jgi:hypothetical protein
MNGEDDGAGKNDFHLFVIPGALADIKAPCLENGLGEVAHPQPVRRP